MPQPRNRSRAFGGRHGARNNQRTAVTLLNGVDRPPSCMLSVLPDWAMRMHGLSNPLLGRPLLRAGTMGVARTLRWAFR